MREKQSTGLRQRDKNGFTLVELLIVLAITGILASRAVPAFVGLVQDLRISTVESRFERLIRHARREALTRRQTVRICASEDGKWCGSPGNWSDGWISYVDSTGDADRQADDKLLRVAGAVQGVQIKHNRGPRISVNFLGRISQNGSVDFCAPDGGRVSRRLVVIHSGRLRLERPSPAC